VSHDADAATQGRSSQHLTPEQPLDREVAAALAVPGRWGVAGVLAFLGVPLAGAVVGGVALLTSLSGSKTAEQLYGLAAAALAGAVTWVLGRRFVPRYGGWRAALGFALPSEGDGRLVTRWSVRQLVVRYALAAALVPLLPDGTHGGNLEGTSDLPLPGLALLGIAAVLVAPVLEELLFRGVLLRALMRRLSFWPAALADSVLFAGLHLGTISDASAVVPTLVVISAFGLLQCQLVRRTASLGPAMGVHAVLNLVTLVLALLTGS
jgi:hypothetical protein